jgi:hypothetical protein
MPRLLLRIGRQHHENARSRQISEARHACGESVLGFVTSRESLQSYIGRSLFASILGLSLEVRCTTRLPAASIRGPDSNIWRLRALLLAPT